MKNSLFKLSIVYLFLSFLSFFLLKEIFTATFISSNIMLACDFIVDKIDELGEKLKR